MFTYAVSGSLIMVMIYCFTDEYAMCTANFNKPVMINELFDNLNKTRLKEDAIKTGSEWAQ